MIDIYWFLVGSWFISPILSGVTSCCLLWVIKKGILIRPDPLEAGLISLPLFYGFTILVNVFSIVHDGPKLLHMDNIPMWMAATISISIASILMVIIWLFVVPWQRRTIKEDLKQQEKLPVNFNIGESTGNYIYSFFLLCIQLLQNTQSWNRQWHDKIFFTYTHSDLLFRYVSRR